MKNIDTFDVLLPIRPDAKALIKSKLMSDDTTRYGVGGAYSGHHPYLPLSFLYICRGCYLQVTVEHEFIVGINSVDDVIEKILNAVTNFFNISRDDISVYGIIPVEKLLYKKKRVIKVVATKCKHSKLKMKNTPSNNILKIKMKLLRRWSNEINRNRNKKRLRVYRGSVSQKVELVEIDRMEYKTDYKIKHDDEKLAAMDIFRITADSRNRCNKAEWKYSNRTNCTYEDSRYVTTTSYFKEFERLADGDVEGAEKYKNILRTEVKVKNAHLNYQRKYRSKTLRSYFNLGMAEKYFKKYIEPIFYTEPFYRLDEAILEIYKQQTLKDFEKDRLADFLTDINKFGITATKELYDYTTFNKYIKKVRQLGVNPLCFSSVIDGKEISIKKMDNFTLFLNGIAEDI